MPKLHRDQITLKPDNVVMKGYLLKESKYRKQWRDRWFVLTPQYLCSFEEEDQYHHPTEFICLSECLDVGPHDGDALSKFICVKTPGRDFNLIAQSPADKEKWIAAIRVHIRPRLKAGGLDQYKIGQTIGKGTFGEVKVATHVAKDEKVAIKIIRNDKVDPERLHREIDLQMRLHHQHVVNIREVFQQDGKTYIVMELVAGGDLFDHIVKQPRMKETTARRIFQQVIAGVEHCHQNGVAHRDLKPENIFMDSNGNVTIGDFGLSGDMREGIKLTDSCGSPNYAAPELLYKNCIYDGPEVDVWSCGVILFALLCNRLPFDADSVPELLRLIKKGKYKIPGYVSDGANDLLSKMLCVEVENRISIDGIRQHPWFAEGIPPSLFKARPDQVKDMLTVTRKVDTGPGHTTDRPKTFPVASSYAGEEAFRIYGAEFSRSLGMVAMVACH
jgi:serine/threonine protein kinase